MKVMAIIPARYKSSRFPGKPLAMIHGKSMIHWVVERVSSCALIDAVYVATDDSRIYDHVTNVGGKAVLTSEKHRSGTDRLAEATMKIREDFDIILNIQGDEPMIKHDMIKDLVDSFNDNSVYMATLKKEIIQEYEINNPNAVKVVTDKYGYAIYFSRSTIPFNRDNTEDVKYYKHIGVYGYTKDFLLKFSNLPQSKLEVAEQLEQLRAIENGYKIKVIETKHESIGVDLPEHIKKVELEMKKEGIV